MRWKPIRTAPLILAATLLIAGAVLPACQPYERVVRYNPPLANLPDAEAGDDVTSRQRRQRRQADPLRQEPNQVRVETDDGEERLISRSPRLLLRHIRDALINDDADIFADQILSEISIDEFYEHGIDPREGFAHLKEHEDDFMALFSRMPMGEQTPGIFMRRVGNNVYRLEVTGPGARELHFRYMDVVSEGGEWRLRWFGP